MSQSDRPSHEPPEDPLHRPLMLGGQSFPGVWRFLLPPNVSSKPFPAERRATCMRCPKVATDGFRADYRCCTYHPRIPNFLLGLALEREGSKQAVEELIAAGFVLPEGTERTPQKWLDALSVDAEGSYGKTDRVLCPLLDQTNGNCRVHSYRNSVCSTYFCLYDAGARSMAVWDVVQEYASGLEIALGQWALRAAGFDLAAYFARFDDLADRAGSLSEPTSGAWNSAALDVLWGDWRGREAELLLRTAAVVRDQRMRLRELAAQTPVLRPVKFEAAERALVPQELANFIDWRERDLDSEGKDGELPAPDVEGLGELLEASLEALWRLPPVGSEIALAPGVSFVPNTGEDEVMRHFASFPFIIRFPADTAASADATTKDTPGDELWELFITAGEREALSYFLGRQSMRAALFAAEALKGVPNGANFLVEWLGYGVLQSLPG